MKTLKSKLSQSNLDENKSVQASRKRQGIPDFGEYAGASKFFEDLTKVERDPKRNLPWCNC